MAARMRPGQMLRGKAASPERTLAGADREIRPIAKASRPISKEAIASSDILLSFRKSLIKQPHQIDFQSLFPTETENKATKGARLWEARFLMQ
jgi:hypothetical protein